MERRRIGVVGYGNLGQYLVKAILSRDDLELSFVWNRTGSALEGVVDRKYILYDLTRVGERRRRNTERKRHPYPVEVGGCGWGVVCYEHIMSPDLIVEVAHPNITKEFGVRLLQTADYMIGSPTALADSDVESRMRAAATHHGLYVPNGALWGGEDIRRMADRGTLQALKITMSKPPASFKLEEPLRSKNSAVTDTAVTLYDGPVRELCRLAPNNVNTMAAAVVAAHNLGFDRVQGSIVADPSLTDWHVVEVEVWGPGDIENRTAFHCKTVRRNPAKIGNVTGSATYASVLASMLGAQGKGPGIHLC